jgi:hypothetical protein
MVLFYFWVVRVGQLTLRAKFGGLARRNGKVGLAKKGARANPRPLLGRQATKITHLVKDGSLGDNPRLPAFGGNSAM